MVTYLQYSLSHVINRCTCRAESSFCLFYEAINISACYSIAGRMTCKLELEIIWSGPKGGTNRWTEKTRKLCSWEQELVYIRYCNLWNTNTKPYDCISFFGWDTMADIQGDSWLMNIYVWDKFLGLCDHKISYTHVSEFGKLLSHDPLTHKITDKNYLKYIK